MNACMNSRCRSETAGAHTVCFHKRPTAGCCSQQRKEQPTISIKLYSIKQHGAFRKCWLEQTD
ncbi:hypothetical protein LDENG_00221430, partial [Lucifuga dentata]